jgi:hypothetical protein
MTSHLLDGKIAIFGQFLAKCGGSIHGCNRPIHKLRNNPTKSVELIQVYKTTTKHQRLQEKKLD